MTPRIADPERAAARRSEILGAAAIEFAARGFDGTRVTDVARRAGVASGTVFYHFTDKAGLFRALFAADGPRNAELAERAQLIEDPLEAVLHLVDGLAAESVDDEAALFVVELIRRVTVDAKLAAIVEETSAVTIGALTDAVSRGVASGRFDATLDSATAAAVVSSMVDGLYLNAEPGRDHRAELRRAVAAYLCSPDVSRIPDV
ncbi:TetR/AcrR family transcriptional regulator [Pseudactinotalea sp.]|uniref:TetR/AcrR family transcriptional regulator n=1 Tax=Pseudactinotalea sp. TaxID=1926260 RepID=UPI003B3A4036